MSLFHHNKPPFRGFGLITAHHRARSADRYLATVLAGVAGCANAGGFMVLGDYTSHMTGYLSQMADNIALQNLTLVLQSALAILCFVAGAAMSAFAINWARTNNPRVQYALPIAAQGVLFLGFAALGGAGVGQPWLTQTALGLLCFIMGLQNATITKISGARIRTTHATGMITDVGIELGKAAYARAAPSARVAPDFAKLLLLLQLLGVFLLGGLIGAVGYAQFGFLFSVPLAGLLLAISIPALR